MSKAIDRSKNHLETHIDKNGHVTKKLVSNKTETKKVREPQWYDKFAGMGLTRLPVGINKEHVQIHVDITKPEEFNSKCVMSWVDPKTNTKIRVYTKEFLNRNSLVKWDRIANVDSNTIDNIKNKAREDLKSSNMKFQEAAAILLIIASTGLRVGQTSGFEKTGNMGVSTLGVENLNINKAGDISFEFIGKSYKNNTAIIQGEPELSKFLKKLKSDKVKSGNNRLFSMDRTFVDKVFKNRYGFKDLKIKDMRTYVATDLGNKILQENTESVKQQLTGDVKKDRKIIVNTLANMYKLVSNKLNNTPKMAETAYIHPIVRKQWLSNLGLSEELLKSEDYIDDDNLPLDTIITYNPVQAFNIDINEDDEEDCDEYNLLDFEIGNHEETIEKSETSQESGVMKFNTKDDSQILVHLNVSNGQFGVELIKGECSEEMKYYGNERLSQYIDQIKMKGAVLQEDIEKSEEENDVDMSPRWKKLIDRKWNEALGDEEFFKYACNKNQDDRDSGEMDRVSTEERLRLLREFGLISKAIDDVLSKSKYIAPISVTNKKGTNFTRMMKVGSDKDPTKTKKFNLHNIGEHYDNHLLSITEYKDNNGVTHTINGKKIFTKNMDYNGNTKTFGRSKFQGESDDVFKHNHFFFLHPDEEAYRDKLINDELSKDSSYAQKRKSIDADNTKHNAAFLVYHDYKPTEESLEYINKYSGITDELYSRDSKTRDELHKTMGTDIGKKIIQEEQRRIAEEIENKNNEIRNKELKFKHDKFEADKSKYTRFFDSISNIDLGDMSVKDFYNDLLIRTNVQMKIKENRPSPVDKNTIIRVHWKMKPASTGTMGDFIDWIKAKKENPYKQNEKVPFSSMEIVSYNQNPYKEHIGFSTID